MSMPVATIDKVKALTKDFGSQRKLADALDVSPAQVSRWIRGQGIDPENAERVDTLDLVMANLARVYEPDIATEWLYGMNPHLRDRQPIYFIRQGRAEEVLAAIRATRALSYA
jgi:DNA-binding transcriptional regulator YdaS (Cro superfamily)